MLRCLTALAATVAFAADPLIITVERARGEQWERTEPSIVFSGGDEIRFRVRSAEAGYLYILNETVRGERLWLYPVAGDPAGNQITAGREYTIPESNASWTVAAQPGFESVYFILTTVRLPSLPAAAPPAEKAPSRNTLLPRCNEGSLRARGVCLDDTAGMRSVEDRRRIEQLIGSTSGRIWIQELRLAHK
jgi:hypothetical protein